MRLLSIFCLALSLAFAACGQSHPANKATKTVSTQDTLVKPEAAWRKQLSADAYQVLFQHGTERPFTGALLKNHKTGTYVCAACKSPLFASTTKFESGTGWPSFYQPLQKRVDEDKDDTYGMTRTEVHCAHCGGHLGHVFDDGPKPTGLRYCINSVSLGFEEGK